MGLTIIRRQFELPKLDGRLRFFERVGDSPIWRKVLDAENIVLNGFYNDLIANMQGGAQALNINGLAIGWGQSVVPARADIGLVKEFNNPVTTLSAQLNNATAYTAMSVVACPEPIPAGTSIQLGAGQTVVTSGASAAGATTININSFTANQNYVIGTGLNVTSWTPQRMSTTATAAVQTDPPNGTWSFYLPAAANQVNVAFTEAGLLYRNSSLTPGDVASTHFATHAVFSYTKNVNTDLRIDYTLARSLT
jgi:hypothetical protein